MCRVCENEQKKISGLRKQVEEDIRIVKMDGRRYPDYENKRKDIKE